MRRAGKWGIIFLVAVAIGVTLVPAVSAQSQRALLLTLDRAIGDTSQTSGLGKALAGHLAANGLLLYPGAPVVQGWPSVVRLLGAQEVLDSVRLTWQPTGGEMSADSALGATWGVTVLTNRSSGRVMIGRYIAGWARAGGGPWKLAVLLLPAMSASGVAKEAGLPRELPAMGIGGGTGPFVSADLAFSKLAGDSGAAVAFARFAARDAQMWSGAGLLIQGPEAVGSLVSGPNSWRWHPVAAGASGDGGMGWTVGQAVISTPEGKTFPTKYVTIWRREVDGAIRFVSDGGNDR